MALDWFLDFALVESVPEATKDAYRGRVPDDLLDLWDSYGYGTVWDGFVKIIDPDRYARILHECLPGPKFVPVMATGLADIVVWGEEQKCFYLIKYRYGDIQFLGQSAGAMASLMLDEEDLVDIFQWEQYPEALALYGPLEFDQCFGYAPLLMMGGSERVDRLAKVRIFEHIYIMTQMCGVPRIG